MIKQVAFALFTLAILVLSFYFAAYGLGVWMDQSKDWEQRWEGAAWVLGYVSILIFLFGMFPQLHGTILLCLGILATLLALASITQFSRDGFPAAFIGIGILAYDCVWWLLARPRISLP